MSAFVAASTMVRAGTAGAVVSAITSVSKTLSVDVAMLPKVSPEITR